MASIDNIKTNIEGPDEIVVNLVREDHLTTSGVFRVGFEISLSLASAILGAILSMLTASPTPPAQTQQSSKLLISILWIFLFIAIFACLAFLYYSHRYFKMAKSKTKPKD